MKSHSLFSEWLRKTLVNFRQRRDYDVTTKIPVPLCKTANCVYTVSTVKKRYTQHGKPERIIECCKYLNKREPSL